MVRFMSRLLPCRLLRLPCVFFSDSGASGSTDPSSGPPGDERRSRPQPDPHARGSEVEPPTNQPERTAPDAVRAAKAEILASLYEKRAETLKWMMGIQLTLFLVFIGYAAWKNDQAYDRAVASARQAQLQAEATAREVEDAGEKVRDRLRTIEDRATQITDKLVADGDAIKTSLRAKGNDLDADYKKKLAGFEQSTQKELDKIRSEGRLQIAMLIKEGANQREAN